MGENEGKGRPDILERTVGYSLRIIKVYRTLEKDSVGRIVGNQLLRSGTSVGANIHEAQGGQSRADFISKTSIAHKEAREPAYWLQLIQKAELVPEKRISSLTDEASRIIEILSSKLITSKKGRQQ